MNVLLIGAVAMIAALILSAWLMTFARWFPIKGIDGDFLVDYKTMIRAHVDYARCTHGIIQLRFFMVLRLGPILSYQSSPVFVSPLADSLTQPFL